MAGILPKRAADLHSAGIADNGSGGFQLSVVVPVYNEAESLPRLWRELVQALAGINYEVIFVDDGSTDNTCMVLRALRRGSSRMTVMGTKRLGQAGAIRLGVSRARACWVVTLDGDGQNDPVDILELLRVRDRHDRAANKVFIGWRYRRLDSKIRLLTSFFANTLRRCLLKDDIADSGCGLKLFRRDAFLALPGLRYLHWF